MAINAQQRLLETASELFYAEGIRAVGVARILEVSGVGRASFYRHFASKDELVVAVLQVRDQVWRKWLASSVEDLSNDPKERPLAVFDALAQRLASANFRGCAFINTMVESADVDSVAHQVAAEHKRDVIDYLSRLLREGGYSNPNDTASDFSLLVDGAIVTAIRDHSAEPALQAKTIAGHLLRLK